MPQAILIVIASVLLGLLGLSRHEGMAQDTRASEQREVEAAALVLAETWAGQVRDLTYDEADVSRTEVRLRNDNSGLSATLGTEGAEVASDPRTYDDVDDFHGFERRESVPVGGGSATVDLDVRVDVTYARINTWEPVSARTTAKVATVTVREDTTLALGRRPVEVVLPVRLTPAQQFVRQ